MLVHRSSALAVMAMVAAAAGTDAATDALLSMEVVQQAPQPIVSGRPCMLFLLSRYVPSGWIVPKS